MLTKDTILDGTYQIIQEIGRGGAGIVYLAYHLRLQKYVVLKNARLNRNDIAYLRNEVDTLKELHHTALPQVYDFLQVDQEIYTVIDYIDGQDFEKIIQSGYRIPEENLIAYMMELSEVLCYLHEHNPPVLHSDIKPGNVMLRQDGQIFLIDFNISIWRGGKEALYGFSQYYTAPEQQRMAMQIVNNMPITEGIDARSDIYSLGATFYFVLTGMEPGANGVLYPLSELNTGYSPAFVRVIETCMAYKPEERYQSAEELLAALKKLIRRGSDFRRRVMLQTLLLSVCGLILCAGIWSLVYGLKEKRHEVFLSEIQQVQEAAIIGDSEVVVNQGSKMLITYGDQSARSPESWCQLLLAVGDGYVDIAEQTGTESERQINYDHAVEYYEDATTFAAEERLDSTMSCLMKWVCLLLNMDQAERLSQPADFLTYLTDAELQYLKAIQETATGDTEMVLRSADLASDEIRAAVYVALASMCEGQQDDIGQVRYLELAAELDASEDILEDLAAAYLHAGAEEPDYYQNALSLYERLAAVPNPSMTERLGYATSLRACGNLEKAKTVIDALYSDYPDSFDVLAQAALIYSQMGDAETASGYAEAAMELAPQRSRTDIWMVLERMTSE